MMERRYDSSVNFIYKCYAVTLISLTLLVIAFSPTNIVLLINGFHTPSLDFFFASITHFGNGIVLTPLILTLLFRRIYMALSLVTSAAIQGGTVSLFKRVLFPSALRPSAFIDMDSVHIPAGVEVYSHMSFPSGHAVTAFGLCVFVSLCYRNNLLTFTLLLLALAVGISRIYLLQHFMMDVAAGAILGTATAMLAFHYFERIPKPQWMRKRIHVSFGLTDSKTKSIG